MRVRSLVAVLWLTMLASPVYAMDMQQAWQAAHTKDLLFSAACAGAEAGRSKRDQARTQAATSQCHGG